MAESAWIRNWRNWVPVVVVGVIVASILIGIQNHGGLTGPSIGFSIQSLVHRFIYFADAVVGGLGPCVLAAAFLLQHKRLRVLAWCAIVFCVLRTALEAMYYFGEEASPSRGHSQLYIAVNIAYSIGVVLLVSLLAFLPRLRYPGRIAQVIAVAATIILFVSFALIEARWLSASGVSVLIVRMVAAVLGLISIPTVAILAVVRPELAPHIPPIDSAATVSLTCPRCQSAQAIPTNGGRCENCKLGIFIALKEGTCRKCHYPLRGLASGACPECGTPVVEGTV